MPRTATGTRPARDEATEGCGEASSETTTGACLIRHTGHRYLHERHQSVCAGDRLGSHPCGSQQPGSPRQSGTRVECREACGCLRHGQSSRPARCPVDRVDGSALLPYGERQPGCQLGSPLASDVPHRHVMEPQSRTGQPGEEFAWSHLGRRREAVTMPSFVLHTLARDTTGRQVQKVLIRAANRSPPSERSGQGWLGASGQVTQGSQGPPPRTG